MGEEVKTNVRLYDIASKLNVTVNTVSKAIRGKAGVSEKMREKILTTAEEMHYVPNRIARSLRYGKNNMVAVIFDTLTNPYFMIMTDMLVAKLRTYGYDALIVSGVWDEVRPSDINGILGHKIDGIITFIEPSKAAIEIMKHEGIAAVLLGRDGSALQIDSAWTDGFQGGYQVGELFLRQGAKKIGYLGVPKHVACGQQRLAGLIQCLKDHGVPYDENNFQFMEEADMTLPATRLMENGADAVFCFNDIIALGFYSFVRRHGLRIPEDVRIVGYDDIQEKFATALCLTSVGSDKEALVDIVVKVLLDKISGKSDPQDILQKQFDVFIREGETA